MRIILLIVLLFVSGLVFSEDNKDYRKSFTDEELREKFGLSEVDESHKFQASQERFEKAKEQDLKILLEKMKNNGGD